MIFIRIMNIAKTIPILSPIEEKKFWNKVFKSTKCWDWIGAIGKNGYGVLKLRSEFYRAHRIAYFLKHGKIDRNLHIDHLCYNRKCVNPKHLEEVTLGENTRRGMKHCIKPKKTHCSRGHPYDKINSQGKQICSICNRERSRLAMRKFRSKCF